MIEELIAVLDTYRTRLAFQVLAVAMLPLLWLSYSFSLDLVTRSASLAYLTLAAPATAVFFAFLGHHLKVQFTNWRLKLLPNYAITHLVGAGILTSIVLLLLSLSCIMLSRTAGRLGGTAPDFSIARLIAILWLWALLAFAAGYFFRPGLFFLMFIPLTIGLNDGVLASWLMGKDSPTTLMLLAANLVLTVALAGRVADANENLFEYRWRDDTWETRRDWWPKRSKDSWLNRIFVSGSDKILNRLEPLPANFLSQVRHFAAGIGVSQESTVVSSAFVVLALWIVRALSSTSLLPNSDDPLNFFTLMPALTVFFSLERSLGKSRQALFMLPLRREEIVSRYGSALFLILLKNWIAWTLAGIILAWMPIPGKILGIPPAKPVLISLLVQLPLFGLCTLVAGRSKMLIVVILMASAFAVALPSQWLLPSAAVIGGPGLIWLSYRNWCRAEA